MSTALRRFGHPPEPELDENGESFISVSVRSDMDLVTTSGTTEPSPSSFAGCVPQILPTATRTAPLAALPSRSVHKLKPGNSCLVRCPEGKDHSKDYAKLPPFSYESVRCFQHSSIYCTRIPVAATSIRAGG